MTPAWSIEQIPEQPGLHNEALSQGKNKKTNKQTKPEAFFGKKIVNSYRWSLTERSLVHSNCLCLFLSLSQGCNYCTFSWLFVSVPFLTELKVSAPSSVLIHILLCILLNTFNLLKTKLVKLVYAPPGSQNNKTLSWSVGSPLFLPYEFL